jgi:hypothetical protein
MQAMTGHSIRKREYKIIKMVTRMLARVIKLKVLGAKQLTYLLKLPSTLSMSNKGKSCAAD